MGWNEYLRSRVLHPGAMVFSAHGHTKERLTKPLLTQFDDKGSIQYLLTKFNAVADQQLKAGTMGWEREHKLSVKKYLSLSGEAFLKIQDNMVDFVEQRLLSDLNVLAKARGNGDIEPGSVCY
jgi:hypothetical protein